MKARFLLAACAAALFALPAFAHKGIHILDPYARIISGTGVVYFTIDNQEDAADTLLSATSVAGMTMLMTSSADAAGVMQMAPVMQGMTVDTHATRTLASAGDHVMLSGVTSRFKKGDTITVTLTFEKAGEVTLTVPIDNTRRTPPGMGPTPFDAMSAAAP